MMVTFFVVSHLSNHSQLSPGGPFFFFSLSLSQQTDKKYTQLVSPIDPTTIQITPFLIHQIQPISYVNTFYISP